MTERGISRILRAAYHAEMGAYRSLMSASRFMNPVGRGGRYDRIGSPREEAQDD